MSRSLARAAAVADRRVTGPSREVLAELVAELGPRWQAREDARLADRPRRRAVGAGARHRLVFILTSPMPPGGCYSADRAARAPPMI